MNLEQKITALENQMKEIQGQYEKKFYLIERYLWGKFDLNKDEDFELYWNYIDGANGPFNPDNDVNSD